MKIIDEEKINSLLDIKTSPEEIREILFKAKEMKGLSVEECAKLLTIENEELIAELFATARKVKDRIYGSRLVLFAPLYCSNFCVNDCAYCAFHVSNTAGRKKLSMDEIRKQVEILQEMGHKRLLLEFGEDELNCPIDYVIEVIQTIYDVKKDKGAIRRVNVNIAATSVENYKKLKAAGIGTYQLFQETYHRPTFEKLHCGPKANYDRQLGAMDKAFAGGIDDMGIGALFGLYDYRFEVLALIQHAEYMEKELGVGPHTISVPRFRPASTVNFDPKYLVSDQDFLKLIAIIRLTVPYTGMIISTRESAEIRRQAFKIGISQASAASRTEPGGYKRGEENEASSQFEVNDHRSLDEVVRDICEQGYLPSFCTGCYRLGRTGDVFMELAKNGGIHEFCQPNALLTFKEFLQDYASVETVAIGEEVIRKELELIKASLRKEKLMEGLKRVEIGERDIYI